MKKVFLSVFILLLTCACGKDEPIAMQRNNSQTVSPTEATQPDTLPVCDAQYAQNLRTCSPFTCQEKTNLPGNLTVVRTISAGENGLCIETITPKQSPAKTDAKPEEGATPPAAQPEEKENVIQQMCTFNETQRNQAADFLQYHFDSKSSGKQQAAAGQAPQNPLKTFLQDGTCTASGFEPQGTITCTGTKSITVITIGGNGEEVSQVITCETPAQPAPKQTAK